MDTNDVVETLNDLIQLDYDAVKAYEQALEKIDVQAIKQQLELFKADHQRHIVDLTDTVRTLGATPKELGRDVKGLLIEGMTALRSVTGTMGALKAMKMNEQLTNRTYQKALDTELPLAVRTIVERNRGDEALHLAYIEQAIEQLRLEAGERDDTDIATTPSTTRPVV